MPLTFVASLSIVATVHRLFSLLAVPQFHGRFRFEYFPHNRFFVFRIGREEFPEFSLRQHDNLTKLCLCKTNQFFRFFIDFRNDLSIDTMEFRRPQSVHKTHNGQPFRIYSLFSHTGFAA